jgi:uncharacterized Zn finger protein (UPF0148 family)
MAAKRCWECSSTFYSDYGAIYCNVCTQARKNRQYQEQQARENAYQQARYNQALINAENQRIAAINHQTRVLAETAIRPKDAYQRGYDYVEEELAYSNSAKARLEIDENGRVRAFWEHPYITDHLNDEFQKGFSAKVNGFRDVFHEIKASATQAGKQNVEGTLPARFRLHTGLKSIHTKTFDSHFIRNVDENTGELTVTWNKPFTNETLNKAYEDGVNEGLRLANTERQKQHRLEFEVPEIQAQRKKTEDLRFADRLFSVSTWAVPILFFLLMWQITSGFVTFFMFIAAIILRNSIKNEYMQWYLKHVDYLRNSK